MEARDVRVPGERSPELGTGARISKSAASRTHESGGVRRGGVDCQASAPALLASFCEGLGLGNEQSEFLESVHSFEVVVEVEMGVDGIQPARRVLDDIVGMEVKHIHFSEQVVVEDEIPTEGSRNWCRASPARSSGQSG